MEQLIRLDIKKHTKLPATPMSKCPGRINKLPFKKIVGEWSRKGTVIKQLYFKFSIIALAPKDKIIIIINRNKSI